VNARWISTAESGLSGTGEEQLKSGGWYNVHCILTTVWSFNALFSEFQLWDGVKSGQAWLR
jgi:hypothetical protein